jgi:hypothetical protein
MRPARLPGALLAGEEATGWAHSMQNLAVEGSSVPHAAHLSVGRVEDMSLMALGRGSIHRCS